MLTTAQKVLLLTALDNSLEAVKAEDARFLPILGNVRMLMNALGCNNSGGVPAAVQAEVAALLTAVGGIIGGAE